MSNLVNLTSADLELRDMFIFAALQGCLSGSQHYCNPSQAGVNAVIAADAAMRKRASILQSEQEKRRVRP